MFKLLMGGLLLLAAMPATSTYELNSYGFGSGGTANSSTSTYALEGITGEISGQTAETSTYQAKPGFIETQQANVPKIASLDNGSGVYYNKLHFVIGQENNPSDATYALQISTTSDFSSDVNYVKADFTIGPTLAVADYQTYTAFGGASGENIIGLTSDTTYYLRAKATQGEFTESAYGPASSAATVNPSLTFSATPTNIDIGSFLPGDVASAATDISISFSTNSDNGGNVYINGSHATAGLYSSRANYTIPSATGDLSSLSHGFGARVTSASGGTFAGQSPYTDGSSTTVGIIDTTIRKIFSATAAVTGGSGSVNLKAKAAIDDPSQTDYTETVTMIAAASF